MLDSPTVSDADYDTLLRELRDLEGRYPELQSEDSPTQRVGGEVAQGFRSHRHPRPMLSLANAFSHEELDAWFRRVSNLVPGATFDFVVEPKIDGLAIALTYVRGELKVGATRGNGIEGEDVTANLRTLDEVPERLNGKDVPERVEVRGEIYMSIDGFERLNERRAAEGASLFANPRNSAAGSLRQLDPNVTRGRPLHLFAYAIGYTEGVDISSQWQALQMMRGWGFPVNPLARQVKRMEEVQAFCDWLAEERERLDYEIDGAVVKINQVSVQEELGAVGREPRWAIAFKFPPRQATTTLRDIQVNVGRTGAINPFAVLEPVTVGGVVVRMATLHNEQDIQRKDIRVGDRVIVHRAGDVIPQVVKPIPEERDGQQKPYHLPKKCPSCGTSIVREENGAISYCPNLECPAQRFRWIEHFASQGAMDIRGLGERIVQMMLDNHLIGDPADLYGLTQEDLLKVPGFQEKSAVNLHRAISRSKTQPLSNVIYALGIRFVGGQTAELLANAFGDMDKLASADVDQLEAVEGIGRKIAESVVEWMSRPRSRQLLEKLKVAGIRWREAPPQVAEGPLTGLTFLITGRLDAMPRGQAESRLRAMGAKIAPGMSKGVNYLIAGADPGSKLTKAEKLGTPVKDEGWLLDLFERGELPANT